MAVCRPMNWAFDPAGLDKVVDACQTTTTVTSSLTVGASRSPNAEHTLDRNSPGYTILMPKALV
jgi:hypothetical protein